MKKKWKITLGITAALLVLTTAAAIDIQPRVILKNGDTVHVEYGTKYEDDDVIAGFEEQISGSMFASDSITCSGTVDNGKLGSYDLTYSLGFGLWKSTCHRTVIVEDTTPPSITLRTEDGAFTVPGSAYEEEGFQASDLHDGDLTAKVKFSEKDGKVYYTVADSSGNEGTAVRDIYYYDPVGPELTLTGGDAQVVVGNEFYDPGYSATDNLDGDLTEQVTVEGDLDTSTCGTYTLTYKVKDSYDNEATATRNVTVIPEGKVIYLTFDDGPYKYTETLLDVLDKYNVKATFFVTNQYPAYQDMIGEEARRGHTVAIHTYSHDYATIYASKDAYYADLNSMNDIIEQQTGSRTNLFRFPGGSSNTVSRNYCSGIMTTLTQSLTADGYHYFDWNVSSGDAGGTTETAQVIANVTAGCEGKDTCVVLQHDIKDFSVNAVEDIIKWGLANGYSFQALNASSPGAHQGVNN